MIRVGSGQAVEETNAMHLLPINCGEHSVEALKSRPLPLIGPGIPATAKIKLFESAVIQHPLKARHHPAMQIIIVLVSFQADHVEVSARKPRASARSVVSIKV